MSYEQLLEYTQTYCLLKKLPQKGRKNAKKIAQCAKCIELAPWLGWKGCIIIAGGGGGGGRGASSADVMGGGGGIEEGGIIDVGVCCW